MVSVGATRSPERNVGQTHQGSGSSPRHLYPYPSLGATCAVSQLSGASSLKLSALAHCRTWLPAIPPGQVRGRPSRNDSLDARLRRGPGTECWDRDPRDGTESISVVARPLTAILGSLRSKHLFVVDDCGFLDFRRKGRDWRGGTTQRTGTQSRRVRFPSPPPPMRGEAAFSLARTWRTLIRRPVAHHDAQSLERFSTSRSDNTMPTGPNGLRRRDAGLGASAGSPSDAQSVSLKSLLARY